MKRREVIKYTALMTGATVGAPLLATLFSGCANDATVISENYHPEFFSAEEFSLVKNIANTILPKSDSPSATDVGVHKMMDSMVNSVYKPDEKENYRKNFDALKSYILEKIDVEKAASEDYIAILEGLEKLSSDQAPEVKSGYSDLKQQTIAYYLSSKEIGSNYLTYLPVPGEYQECITVEEAGGKAWAI